MSSINFCLSKDSGFGMLMGKLQRALAADAFENPLVTRSVIDQYNLFSISGKKII
jgi:hypothetical protein